MEKFQESREKAERCLKIADHMLFVTYPLVKDDKLLMAILENIFLTFTNSMGSVLYYERLFKRIPPFHDNYESKLNLFIQKVMPQYNIDRRFVDSVVKARDLLVERKLAPVEFTKQGKFIIFSKDYQMRAISVDELKGFVQVAKEFVKLNNRIIEKNEYIFR